MNDWEDSGALNKNREVWWREQFKDMFGHVDFEMLMGYPGGDVQQAAGDVGPEIKMEIRAKQMVEMIILPIGIDEITKRA